MPSKRSTTPEKCLREDRVNKSELTAAGFAAVKRSPKRVVGIIQSISNAGKTRLALTARRPIGYIAIEVGGEEGVIDQFIPPGAEESGDIQIVRITMPDPQYDPEATDAQVTQAVQSAAGAALDQFYSAYYASLANMATTVVDTGDDVWEIARLANFGRLEKVPQLAYTQLNRAFDKLIDDAFSYPGSVLWCQHMKEKWEQYTDPSTGKERGRPTGTYDMAGYRGMVDKVQTIIELWREDLQEPNPNTGRMIRFNAQVIKSRHNADAIGAKFEDDDITLANIGMKLIPASKISDWV